MVPGDVIAIGYRDGSFNVLVQPGSSKEGAAMFRGWWPWPLKDRWGKRLWNLEPLHTMIGPIVTISWTAPSLPLHVRFPTTRRLEAVRQTHNLPTRNAA